MNLTLILKDKLLVLILLMVAIYSLGAFQHSTRVNIDSNEGDQIEYIKFAKKAKASSYIYAGGRNRMPAYPFIQSVLNDTSLEDRQFFERGKVINIGLSLLLLMLIFTIVKKRIGYNMVGIFLMTIAFSVYIFKAGYVQPELLFYTLVFVAFLLMVKMLSKASLHLGFSIGIILGLAHLTKAAVLPALILFGLFYSAKYLSKWIIDKRINFIDLSSIIILFLSFLLVISPYINQSKQIYGQYFYNVNSTFYMWTDSWSEAKSLTREHGDRNGWPNMPDDEIPSLEKYVREHKPIDPIYRILKYSKGILKECLASYGYQYFILLSLAWLFLSIKNCWRTFTYWIKTNRWLTIFLITYFGMHFLLYAWYGPIELGNRLILAQFLPFYYILLKAIQCMRWKLDKFYLANTILWIVLAYPMTLRLLSKYAGS